MPVASYLRHYRFFFADVLAHGFAPVGFTAFFGFDVSAGGAEMAGTAAAPVFFRIVSPGRGCASGCLKYTGKRIETGVASPRVFAGMNLSSDEPFTAAESSG